MSLNFFVMLLSVDGSVYIWNHRVGTLIQTLRGHSGVVNAVSWSPRGGLLASASDDHTIRIWSGDPR